MESFTVNTKITIHLYRSLKASREGHVNEMYTNETVKRKKENTNKNTNILINH